MEDDFDIEIYDEEKPQESPAQLPLNFISFGEIESDDIKVYIKQDVYKALEKYARVDTDHERGTIILGNYYEELGKMHVIISNYIEAKYTDASASTLTFTHKTWDYVHSQQEKLYPDKKIVGWQHTHPSYGIFLSNYDLFIHENFFDMPFQVAYVIDPIQNLRGFFQWKNGKIEKLKGYYIYDDVGKPIKFENEHKKENNNATKVTPNNKPSKATNTLIGVLICLCVILAILNVSTSYKYSELQSNQSEIIDKVKSQDSTIAQQSAVIKNLQEKAPDVNTEEIRFVKYTVQKNDSLYSICEESGISYSEWSKLILAINNIKNPNRLYIGQTILLPVINS